MKARHARNEPILRNRMQNTKSDTCSVTQILYSIDLLRVSWRSIRKFRRSLARLCWCVSNFKWVQCSDVKDTIASSDRVSLNYSSFPEFCESCAVEPRSSVVQRIRGLARKREASRVDDLSAIPRKIFFRSLNPGEIGPRTIEFFSTRSIASVNFSCALFLFARLLELRREKKKMKRKHRGK